jgi:hypothetical protein
MRRTALPVALLLLAAVAVAQQNGAGVPLGARLKLRWQEGTVYLRDGGASYELSLRDQIHAARLDKVKLQSAKESNGFVYLLLDVSGPSKFPADNHQCGAGTESDLIWLKLDKAWKRVDARSVLYDSCWSPVTAVDPPQWQGDTLKVTADSLKGGAASTLIATYSYRRPEEGLNVSETAATK